MISDNVVNDQYREVTFRANCYFPEEYDPELSESYVFG